MALDIYNIARSQGMDPVLLGQLQPYVQQTVGNFGSGRNLTEADINRMTNEVMASSQLRGFPSTGQGGRSKNDLVRLLILLNLYNNGYNVNPFWLLYFGGVPFFLWPFLGGGRPPVQPVPPIGWLPIQPMPPGRPPMRPRPPAHRPPKRPRPFGRARG